jgi:tetratricopeptide (TPR) repeat protein
MLINNYANLMMEKGNFPRAEKLFNKALALNPGFPHTYFGLALLYRMAGHLEERLSVIESLIASIPKTSDVQSSQVYKEAEELYREIEKELAEKGSVH